MSRLTIIRCGHDITCHALTLFNKSIKATSRKFSFSLFGLFQHARIQLNRSMRMKETRFNSSNFIQFSFCSGQVGYKRKHA